jgi:hypothetical protein
MVKKKKNTPIKQQNLREASGGGGRPAPSKPPTGPAIGEGWLD